MKVTKIFTFDAGHRLSNYEGKCKHLHGHTYTLEITVEGGLDKTGMVMDFGELKRIFNELIDPKFDHKFMLNRDDPENQSEFDEAGKGGHYRWFYDSVCWVGYNPTAENIATDIFAMFKNGLLNLQVPVELVSVKLFETPTSFAEITI